MTLLRVIGIITREFYARKFGFEILGDNIKVFYNKRDIIEVRVYDNSNKSFLCNYGRLFIVCPTLNRL